MVTIERPSLTLKRRFKAPPSRVYAAWTQARQLAHWFGPANATIREAEAEARVGGCFRLVFMADGEEFDLSGVYREVVPNEKLVITWAWRRAPERESLVTVTFRKEGDGTLLTLHHEQFFDEPSRDLHQQGWAVCLDTLETHLNG